MEAIDRQELIELASSAKTYATAGGPDERTYRTLRDTSLKSPQDFQGSYLFSLPTWDAFEIHTADTVKLFNGEDLNHENLKLPTQQGETIVHPVPPALRYFVLTPGSLEIEERQRALKLFNQPFIDRAILIAAVLTDSDIYVPAGAMHTGATPEHQDKVAAVQAVHDLIKALNDDLDRSQLAVPAPELRQDIVDWISLFQKRDLESYERADLIRDLMSLDDLSFMETLTQMIPWAWRKNEWFVTTPNIAKRAYKIKQSNPGIKGKNRGEIRKAPHKTAWMRPAPYNPVITYQSLSKDRVYPRPHYEREDLFKT